jgi:hypothetical protein
MNLAKLLTLVMGGKSTPYYQQMLARFGSDVVAYLRMADAVGAVAAADASGNSRPGTPTDVTFGVAGIGDGATAADFNGASSQVQWDTPAAFPRVTGAMFAWIKPFSDANAHAAFYITSGGDFVLITKRTDDLIGVQVVGGGAFKQANSLSYGVTTGEWVLLTVTWNMTAGTMDCYINNTVFANITGLGATFDEMAYCLIGAGSGSYWKSNYGPFLLIKRAATTADIAEVVKGGSPF